MNLTHALKFALRPRTKWLRQVLFRELCSNAMTFLSVTLTLSVQIVSGATACDAMCGLFVVVFVGGWIVWLVSTGNSRQASQKHTCEVLSRR